MRADLFNDARAGVGTGLGRVRGNLQQSRDNGGRIGICLAVKFERRQGAFRVLLEELGVKVGALPSV